MMQDFRNFDPQRLERLEARFKGTRSQPPIVIDDDSSQSAGSHSPQTEDDIQALRAATTGTPERKDRRRKRKLPENHDQNSGGGHGHNAKKISEYFKTTGNSPGRAQNPVLLPRSPSASQSVYPPSPSGSSNHVDLSTMSYPPSQMPRRETATCATQTIMTMEDIYSLEGKVTSGIRESQTAIQSLKQTHSEAQRQLEVLQKQMAKGMSMTKKLLIEKSDIDMKEARRKSMENRLRLGQFTTKRQGAQFVETWQDGYAFTDLIKQQERLSKEKEEIEHQRKLLTKKKPPTPQSATAKASKAKAAMANGPDDVFAKPLAEPAMTPLEYYERDEIFKLRLASLRKEEADLQSELEKLERERNVHIRELKRIHNEDQSRFNQHQTLNNHYLLLGLLGKGGFSEVHKGFDLKEQRYVACKIHQLNKEWKEDKKANYIKHALREYEIHKSLDHQRVVKLYDVFEIDSNSFCTVLEYCPGNDLDFYLKQHKIIGEREARSIMMQTISALKYLNERKPPVIHYDLKPGNILLSSGNVSGEIKITDFGLSKIMDDDHFNSQEGGMDLTSQGAGTYWYLPPECFQVGQEPPKISSKVDVWSVGIIFYQCLYGKKPFGHNLSQASILEQKTILKATQVQFPTKPVVSSEAKDFIRQCLVYQKEDRVDVLTLAKQPYLLPVGGRKNLAANNSIATANSVSSSSVAVSSSSTTSLETGSQ
ncbi:serine/threonine-protein kinase tousled-like 2 [Patiria miniata]|uniref:non-specific serine/threonine protein kinase n=1 Tax=Patiria miniata TaxID=46514 RepID=A0A913YYZ7_PATMI|nr:serine/threonine-protein kinase tousled-like 2 [Patiria miniata]